MKRLLILPILLITASQAETWGEWFGKQVDTASTKASAEFKKFSFLAANSAKSQTKEIAKHQYGPVISGAVAGVASSGFLKYLLGQKTKTSWTAGFRHGTSAFLGLMTGLWINQQK